MSTQADVPDHCDHGADSYEVAVLKSELVKSPLPRMFWYVGADDTEMTQVR